MTNEEWLKSLSLAQRLVFHLNGSHCMNISQAQCDGFKETEDCRKDCYNWWLKQEHKD